jgi:hypothetical protein
MPETTTERLAALIAVLAAIGLVFFAVANGGERAVHVTAPAEAEAAPAATTTATEELVARDASPPATTKPPPARTATLVLRAARGDCWLSVRAGSPDGNVLYEGVLVSGKSVSVRGERLWVRLGAASNLDLTLNGKRLTSLAAGTFDVVATPRGIRPAA